MKKKENQLGEFLIKHPTWSTVLAGLIILLVFLLVLFFLGALSSVDEFSKAYAPSFIAAVVVWVMISVNQYATGKHPEQGVEMLSRKIDKLEKSLKKKN